MNYALVAAIGLMICVIWAAFSLLSLLIPIKPITSRKQAVRSLAGSLATFILICVIYIASGVDSRYVSTNEVADSRAPAKSESGPPAPEPSPPIKEDAPAIQVATQETTRPQSCGAGGITSDEPMTVSDYGYVDLVTKPDAKADKIKDAEMSRATGKTMYVSIGPKSNFDTICIQNDWTQVEIPNTEETGAITGWVKTESLRKIEYDNNGYREFVEGDISWDKNTSKYKKEVVAAVNRISRENEQCKVVDTWLIGKSNDRSKPGDPVFYMACEGPTGLLFNVWFKPKDVAYADASYAGGKPPERTSAINACEAYAKSAATHPSTVDFSRTMDMVFLTSPTGRAEVNTSFTAKNGFNLEIKYQIRCLYEGNKMTKAEICEI